MSMIEFRNLAGMCLDFHNTDAVVLHEVSYQVKDSGVWVDKKVQVMATDPMDAIDHIRKGLA
jgi:hypothetical protein